MFFETSGILDVLRAHVIDYSSLLPNSPESTTLVYQRGKEAAAPAWGTLKTIRKLRPSFRHRTTTGYGGMSSVVDFSCDSLRSVVVVR